MAVDDLHSGTWVTYVGGRATSARLRRCRLEVTSGPDAGLVRDVEAQVIRIGARRGNDVQLTDSKVSGLHCEIRLDDRGYRLRDLDSTNGTYVSSLRINDVYIQPGAQIALGGTRLKFDPLGDSIEIELADTDRFGSMIGRSVKMRELFARLEKLAKTDTTVLVTGETGIGKELVAEALARHVAAQGGPFVVLDCGSIPPNLIESELFGHERGAFTGATSAYAGAFERAHSGTVFLDEIGELPLALQPKLLRVLERKSSAASAVRRPRSSTCASSPPPTATSASRSTAAASARTSTTGSRSRASHVPPLRERKDDMPLLVEHILATTPGGEAAPIGQETIDLMMKHDWPGNVRELRNVLERAVLLAETPDSADSLRRAPEPAQREPSVTVTPSHTATASQASMTVPVDVSIPFKLAKQNVVSEFERRYISRLLAQYDGNISAAARAAGIDRMSIHKMLHRLGLDNPGRE